LRNQNRRCTVGQKQNFFSQEPLTREPLLYFLIGAAGGLPNKIFHTTCIKPLPSFGKMVV
ncbi:hypothetical protein, partial [Oscillibacter sp. UBA6647]|uniref:hypothetical protein n=1 Tax=Oscillibacter sp. UBA6647 TaxID=1947021 RepID=UPI0025E7CC41